MLSSPKRIIKVRRPISKITVISAKARPDDGSPDSDPFSDTSFSNQRSRHDAPEENFSAEHPPQPDIHLTEEAYQKALDAATAKGFEEGEAAGYQKASAEFQSAMVRLNQWVDALNQQQQKLIGASEEFVLDLVFRMSEKIVQTIGQHQREVIGITLKRILQKADIAGRVKILVHPRDIKAVEELEGELRKRLPDLKELGIIEDATILPGGCIVETDLGKLDATLETQMNEMVLKLRKIYRSLEEDTENLSGNSPEAQLQS